MSVPRSSAPRFFASVSLRLLPLPPSAPLHPQPSPHPARTSTCRASQSAPPPPLSFFASSPHPRPLPPSPAPPFQLPSTSLPVPPQPLFDTAAFTHPSHPKSHDRQPSTRSSGSKTPASQLYSFHLCPEPPQSSPFQLIPTSALALPKKTFYLFKNGASGIPKSSNRGALLSSSSSSPSPSPLSSGLDSQPRTPPLNCSSVQVGEDSYFLRNDSLGVADGVGGWSGRPGANPGLFSRRLMQHCCSELDRYDDINDVKFLSYSKTDPVDVLQQAFDRSIFDFKNEGFVGSSTALIAVLRNDELRIANLGDCCCSIIRGTDYIFRTEEQQHSFNYPVQLGTNSNSVPMRDAQRFRVRVQKNDVVILSSDGLVDNLFDEDILQEVLKFTSQPTEATPQLLSQSLCLKAKTVSQDQCAITSPFAQRASEEGIHYVGGKNDDISVLVAIVGDSE